MCKLQLCCDAGEDCEFVLVGNLKEVRYCVESVRLVD